MTTLLSASEAAHRLGVQPATLYAYVSRGRVHRVRGLDGRRSLFAADEIEALAESTRRTDVGRPSLVPVRVDSAITELSESALTFRRHDAVELSATASFEQVCELLWTGVIPDSAGPWTLEPSLDRQVRAAAAANGGSVFSRLAAALLVHQVAGDDPLVAARVAVAAAPSALGGPADGTIARRVAGIWFRQPDGQTVDAVRRVMVLLADHELATCALAARVAASTRAELSMCLVAGLSALSGPLHGGAAAAVHELLVRCESNDPERQIIEMRSRRQPVPGFGHKVYKSGDPRVAPILAAVRRLDVDPIRREVVEAFVHASAERVPALANVDLALGALSYVADLPTDAAATMFGIARLAGMAAHVFEEYDAQPLRYRTTARYPE